MDGEKSLITKITPINNEIIESELEDSQYLPTQKQLKDLANLDPDDAAREFLNLYPSRQKGKYHLE